MDKISAFGTELYMNSSLVAGVKSISGPGLSADTEDVTTHDQAHFWEEQIVTILRSGEATIDLVYDPADASQVDVLAELVGRDEAPFEVRFPDTAQTMWSFNAFVTGFEPSAPVDGSLTASMTIKLSGDLTLDDNWSA